MLDLIKRLYGVFIAVLYRLNPRKDIVLFHSDYYRDNAKYLYEYLCDKTQYKLVWILNDKNEVKKLNKNGIKAVYSLSLKGLFVCSRLKMIITTNVPPIATIYINPIIVQVFHGFGTKQNPTDSVLNTNKKQLQKQLRNINYIVCLSQRDEEYFFQKEKLAIDNQYPKYLPLGLPRNDLLLNNNNPRIYKKLFIDVLKVYDTKKVILYAPTWREKPEGVNFSDFWFFNELETKRLVEYINSNNYILLLRPHHHCLSNKNFKNEIVNLENNYPNTFKIVGADIWSDTQELLSVTDFLITDFSSIFVDFLLTKRPIAYLDMDTDDYIKHRGLVIDYYNNLHTPGPKIKCLNDLVTYLEDINNGLDKYSFIRNESLEFYHDNSDGHSTERVGKLVLNLLNTYTLNTVKSESATQVASGE